MFQFFKEPPHPGWMPILKMIFGIMALALLCIMAVLIALFHVEEKTSYGLVNIITIIGVLSGAFSNWAFNTSADKKKEG